MPEGGEGSRTRSEETEHVIAEADAALAANREIRRSEAPAPTRSPEPFIGLGEDAAEYRDRFDRLLALTVGTRREVRRNEDGSKTAFAFVSIHAADHSEVVQLREAASLASVKEAFAPLTLTDQAGAYVVHLGYEETVSKDALPGRLQDPPWSHPEHGGTRETPL